MENTEYVKALRQLADFYDSHPNAPNPGADNINIFIEASKLADAARAIGSSEKSTDDTYFILRKTVGPWTIDFFTYRAEVCERIVVGVKTVPGITVPARPEEFIPEHEEEIVEYRCPESILDANPIGEIQ